MSLCIAVGRWARYNTTTGKMGNPSVRRMIPAIMMRYKILPTHLKFILCNLIQSIPYIILMKNKSKIGEMSGPNKDRLKNLITSALK